MRLNLKESWKGFGEDLEEGKKRNIRIILISKKQKKKFIFLDLYHKSIKIGIK